MRISHERLKELLHYDPLTGIWRWRVHRQPNIIPGKIAGFRQKSYIKITVNGRGYYAHILAWFYMTEQWPDDEIDHKNTVKNDNRRINLREATRAGNCQNSSLRYDNASGYKGVSFYRPTGKWVAQIGGRSPLPRRIGYFETKEEASEAYKAEAIRLFGEFARF